MSHRAIIRIEAEVDITNAAVWYERQQQGLGQVFLAEIESAVASAAAHPIHASDAGRKFDACSLGGSRTASFSSAALKTLSSSAYCMALVMTASGKPTFRKSDQTFARI